MKISTTLVSGAGNTFHIIWKSSVVDTKEQQRITEIICKNTPADGLIFLNQAQDHFKWDFYNNDGSVAEMCGNATRCVGFYIKNKLSNHLDNYQLNTIAGPIQITALSPEKFQIQMTKILELESKSYFYCDTGVPHIVIPIDDF